jgi:putative ABC transport system substrate-binding protein
MRRRDFIKVIAGSAAAWPLAARAQQPGMPVVGFLKSTTPDDSAHFVRAFRQGLSEAGFAEGRNVTIEYRWAENQLDRLPELAAELVRRGVAVIATPADTPATFVAKAATATIPIVFEIGGDPVRAGLVASFNQPGGNVTGSTSMNLELSAKLLGLLHELLPQAARFAVLVNPNNSTIAEATITDARAAAMSMGRQIEILTASTNREIDMVFASLGSKQADALLVNNDPFFNSRRVHLVTLATYHRLPTIYPYRECVEVGGLMSYGANLPDLVRQVGVYSGRILNGERPADLPVLRATKFELVINLQTAKTFGLVVPPTLLARADEVIE